MVLTLTDPMFHDEDAARAHLEAVRWPSGANCPHCGSVNVLRMEGEAHRKGLFNCRDCRKQFSVTVGGVFERSHVALHKWVLATHLLTSSKKGMSSHQLSRMLGVTYKTAWFMSHRIREAMTDPNPAQLGGKGKIVEADEMYHGKREIPVPSPHRRGAPYLKRGKAAEKRIVIGLVERAGAARAVHLPERVTANNVRSILLKHADIKSRLHTDESKIYPAIGAAFATHETVHHAAKEYARGDVTTNSVEGFFGIFKRGMTGVYHHCGEQHLQRYLNEFTFRYSHRIKLGVDDAARATLALKGVAGKRLTYRRINAA